MDARILKRKTMMLLYEIEAALGSFVRGNATALGDIPESVIAPIIARTKEGKVSSLEGLEAVLENSYLDEIFQIAQASSANTSAAVIVDAIKKLARAYNLYEIRNAVAHPNRPFIECYWYRAAAFASDPLVRILGLNRIWDCLESAENGVIGDPPDDWLERRTFEVRNNLPSKFEHDITGLIGRSEDSAKLLKLLENPRVNTIALIAPGGVGKTALVLDLLHQQIRLPATSRYADAIIFVSMKIEALTLSGVSSITAAQTVEELKNEIVRSAQYVYEVPFENFEECKDYLSDEQLLICIDNLETLLRDHPDAFDNLNLELPSKWRVVVTSRTLINANQIVRLDPLQERASEILVRAYMKKKGEKQLPQDVVSKVAADCYFNPLAIRLTLDRVIAGNPIPSAITASRADIAEFSFRNLLDALSDDAVKVLEALFLNGASTRSDVCELVDITLDDAADVISKLLKTSLVNRRIGKDVEELEISSSVRDILVANSKNIEVRSEILRRKNEMAMKAKEVDKRQVELSISLFHRNYIPQDTHPGLKIILEELNRCNVANFEKLGLILKKFEGHQEVYARSAIFHKYYARLLCMLKDFKGAILHASNAAELNPADSTFSYELADIYFRSKDFEKSEKVYRVLIDDGWGSAAKSNIQYAVSIWHGFLQSLLHLGDYQSVFKYTENWKSHDSCGATLGGYRATAYKRSVENSMDKDPAKYRESMLLSMMTMSEVFSQYGHMRSPSALCWKIFEEMEYCLNRHYHLADSTFTEQALAFVASHIIPVFENTEGKLSSASKLIVSLRLLDIAKNPLLESRFNYLASGPVIFSDDAVPDEYVVVRISNVPKTVGSSYLFAKDDSSATYFLHKENASDEVREMWASIVIGTQFAVLPGELVEGKTAIPVKDIRTIAVRLSG